MKVVVNLNEHVLVKLDDSGYKMWHEYWHRNDAYFGKDLFPHITVEQLKTRADKDGYSEFQLWDFMQVFGGENIDIGQKSPYDLNVIIITNKTQNND